MAERRELQEHIAQHEQYDLADQAVQHAAAVERLKAQVNAFKLQLAAFERQLADLAAHPVGVGGQHAEVLAAVAAEPRRYRNRWASVHQAHEELSGQAMAGIVATPGITTSIETPSPVAPQPQPAGPVNLPPAPDDDKDEDKATDKDENKAGTDATDKAGTEAADKDENKPAERRPAVREVESARDRPSPASDHGSARPPERR